MKLIPATASIGLLLMLFTHTQCQMINTPATDTTFAAKSPQGDSLKPEVPVVTLPAYDSLKFINEQSLPAAPGTKSVLFNRAGNRLYAMNLEGMSVYEYDAEKRRQLRSFVFKATPGMGWNYEKDRPVKSYEEKPVEACLSKDENLLWVSLHNAAGVVALPVQDVAMAAQTTDTGKTKRVFIVDKVSNTKDSIRVPIIHTGATPKVIARTGNDSFVLVSNWHSFTISALQRLSQVPYLKKIADVKVAAIPRGIAVDDIHNKSYIAIMGGNAIAVIDNATWTRDADIPVASNPRHVVMDEKGRLFVSFNNLAKISCIDPQTRTTLFTASTAAQPRSIMLSKNGKFLFVTCYAGNKVDVFKVEDDRFRMIYSLPCKGKPVGIDIRETDTTLEAWVCNYVGGNLSIFSFKKNSVTAVQ
jgi:DNA-binding beta-propeller fold protein YncE